MGMAHISDGDASGAAVATLSGSVRWDDARYSCVSFIIAFMKDISISCQQDRHEFLLL